MRGNKPQNTTNNNIPAREQLLLRQRITAAVSRGIGAIGVQRRSAAIKITRLSGSNRR